MKAEIYGLCDRRGRWDWRMTLDYEADDSLGFGLSEACVGVIRFGPEWSVGQAAYLTDKLNATCKRKAYFKEIRREFVKGCREIGISRTVWSNIHMVRSKIKSTASTSSRAPLTYRVLDQMIRILAGRSLLSGELLALMEESGLGDCREEWARYVQAGVSRGHLQLVSGMEITASRSWLGGHTVHVTCRRCGTSGSRQVREQAAGSSPGAQVFADGEGSGDEQSGKKGIHWTFCRDCGGMCAYCEECLTMGRVKMCSVLIRGMTDRPAPYTLTSGKKGDTERWKLSPAQEAAAQEGLRFLESTAEAGDSARMGNGRPPSFLIWAVTGAGKTEMIFPLIEFERKHGRKVLLATPRKDVVLELKPRIAKAFPEEQVTALYGGSESRWETGDITLATTHQLMRFYRAFDLVIIDELDAFPYHNNPMLEFAAREVCRQGGRYVMLSATPPARLQKAARQNKLPHVKVPVRYHRHPLPVPQRLALPPLEIMVKRGYIPGSLLRAMQTSVGRGAQVFVFVPKIALVEPLVRLLSAAFPAAAVDGTSSKDEARSEKVAHFRGKKIDLLVTTTILERGVTVPKTDVFILGADASYFDEAALVQMAGRAGRSMEDPEGKVYFVSKEWTRSQVRAIGQIRAMNRIAAAKGYLLEREMR